MHALVHPQMIQYLLSFWAAEHRILPPWTGRVVFRFSPATQELYALGDMVSAYPERDEVHRLTEYCQALANMLVAYAQLPGTLAFELVLEAGGGWKASQA